MSTPNTESVDAKLVATFDDADAYGPGALIWEVKPDGARMLLFMLLFMVPGEDYLRSIQVVEGAPGGPRIWGWDGNEREPTITPSINCLDGSHWHGFLTAGRFRSC